ncbi:MAG: response regulator transcription factor [Gammaproteobacteria bacterium]
METISILIVDDDNTTRELLRSILNSMQFKKIYTATDGDQAISQFNEIKPDLIFLDIEMPVKDGFETMKEMLATNPDQYIAIVSSHSTMDYVKRAIENGAKGFIVKPYTPAKVKDIVVKYLRGLKTNEQG